MKWHRLFALVVVCAGLAACGGGGSPPITTAGGNTAKPVSTAAPCVPRVANASSARYPDWSTATHGKSATANASKVFPTTQIPRLDLSMAGCDWQSVLTDAALVTGQTFPSVRQSVSVGGPFGCTGGSAAGDGEFLNGTPVWVPVNVTFEGNTWQHVGLRLKGGSSLVRSWNAGLLKLPFRLDFDRFEKEYPAVKDQRFYGYSKLSFTNNAMDDSFLREKISTDLLREFGVPAALAGWARVYLDVGDGPRYMGLFAMTEMPSKTLLEREFGNSSGNLYKPQGAGANWAAVSSNPVAVFQQSFEKENNASAQDWSDVRAAVDALHSPDRLTDPEAWRAGLATRFNMDGFLQWMAANAVLGNGDSYGFIAHNYYLYADTASGKLSWIPWDLDLALTCPNLDPRYPAPAYTASAWPLLRYVLDDPVFRAQYLQHAANFLASPQFDTALLTARVNQAVALVTPFVTGAQAEALGSRYSTLDSAAQFDLGVAQLRSVIAQRSSVVPAMLN